MDRRLAGGGTGRGPAHLIVFHHTVERRIEARIPLGRLGAGDGILETLDLSGYVGRTIAGVFTLGSYAGDGQQRQEPHVYCGESQGAECGSLQLPALHNLATPLG